MKLFFYLQKQRAAILLAIFLIASTHYFFKGHRDPDRALYEKYFGTFKIEPRETLWTNYPQRHPIRPDLYASLPDGKLQTIPQIQRKPSRESRAQRRTRLERLEAVRAAFVHTWEGYAGQAWLHDEMYPIAGSYRDNFGGWAATLVDSLDTLWIMGFKEEFAFAVNAIKDIDYSTTDKQISVFETTIRFLGGLLGAYDVSGGKFHVLLDKAVELADFLYMAFDTSTRMPIANLHAKSYLAGPIEAATRASFADFASLSLEFTRLSQLTGNNKYYDAVQRVNNFLEASQNQTMIPGLWPTFVDLHNLDASRERNADFSLGAMADSAYEYLPKMHLLLGGRSDQTLTMYERALAASKQRLFFRHANPENRPLMMAGEIKAGSEDAKLDMRVQHLTCFIGGMVGMGARILGQEEDIDTARQLTDACVWAYKSMPSGIMPEIYYAHGCPMDSNCTWDEQAWFSSVNQPGLLRSQGAAEDPQSFEEKVRKMTEETGTVPGMSSLQDRRYLLRPEAVESTFYMYRLTGDRRYQDDAWDMFQAIEREARTDLAYAEVTDVSHRGSGHTDTMESFWTGETLKYLFLIFSEPDHFSLDEYVYNTEAHPFLRPKI